MSCLVLSCLVLSCLVLSCLVLSCLVLSCLILSCLVLSCLVLSCLVLSCLVLSCLILFYLNLSCLVLPCLTLSNSYVFDSGLMMYFRTPASRTFQNYGHTWTAFWWWPKDATWPVGARDVLEHPYGTCKDTDVYCFQRLPPWVVEDHTKLLAIDSAGNVLSWKFSSKNPTAHAAWRAFHDHSETKPGAIFFIFYYSYNYYNYNYNYYNYNIIIIIII